MFGKSSTASAYSAELFVGRLRDFNKYKSSRCSGSIWFRRGAQIISNQVYLLSNGDVLAGVDSKIVTKSHMLRNIIPLSGLLRTFGRHISPTYPLRWLTFPNMSERLSTNRNTSSSTINTLLSDVMGIVKRVLVNNKTLCDINTRVHAYCFFKKREDHTEWRPAADR